MSIFIAILKVVPIILIICSWLFAFKKNKSNLDALKYAAVTGAGGAAGTMIYDDERLRIIMAILALISIYFMYQKTKMAFDAMKLTDEPLKPKNK